MGPLAMASSPLYSSSADHWALLEMLTETSSGICAISTGKRVIFGQL